MYTYKTKGICAKQINFDVKDNRISNVSFIGGCGGNLGGISRLLEGLTVDDAISRLKGIDCGGKGTSCPDQFVSALEALLESK